ncbi:bifunctional lysylphosphatidylglycerol flippase/synthetase MprF [Rhizobium sp. CSW-27]|uniref:bifunctional lysylphosphatidylglycerol flippase/synthetase MprF n=1 Tax=Rhizobium sp. CSW-27 TaxID=2839985 RepID=UPI001C00D218|nr:bifunctional lysylphosphatidylglycerol flippase/synthetase MprF [Rhizobium sp. CSW-27]MBT9371972.1 bifunctional lysylphosphatidylglycerol flippase/synthetase MprF [Rhizobium sp. CSW-27]
MKSPENMNEPEELGIPTEPARSAIVMLLARFRIYLTSIAMLVVAVMMAVAIYRLTSEVRYDEVVTALKDTSWRAIGLAVLFTALSFAALIYYDMNALDYIGRRLPAVPVAVTAFSAYAIGNTAGFGALSGGAIRFRAYSRLGLSPEDIARVIAFVTFAFGLGLLAVSAMAALVTAPRLAAITGMEPDWLRAGAVVVLAALALLLFVGRNGRRVEIAGIRLRLPDTLTSSRQFLITAFDLAVSATTLYVLLPETNIGWPSFFAIYAAAIGLGVLSHVPAGLGVFEAVILGALGGSVSVDALLGSIVLYRMIYHVLPLTIAIVSIVFSEARALARHPMAGEIATVATRISPPLLSAFALMLGTMLIFSSVTPTPDGDLDIVSQFLPLPIVEGAHFLSSLLGLALVIASRGLAQRLDGAWWVALVSASLAFAFSFMRALALGEATFLGLFVVALAANGRRFRRPASLFNQVLSLPWIMAMLVILAGAATILFLVYRDVDYSHQLWWQFEFFGEAPRGLRALLGVTILSLAVAIFSLLRPAFHHPEPLDAADLEKAIAILDQSDNADANLVRMGDKRVMFSDSGKSFIMFAIQGRSWIALGDPVGDPSERAEMIWRFVERSRGAGGRAVFYQVSPALLSFCADAGLRAFKLGEMAIVDLVHFDLKGGRLAGLRQALNKGRRDGMEFEIIETEEVMRVMPDLRRVSDGWLAHHNTREKGFSLGVFEEGYVASLPVAVLRKEGQIVAFATIFRTATLKEGSVDLMRFSPDAPRGAMDFLFVSLLEYLKNAGYSTFNLGMAPLSGMSKREVAPVWDRIGGTLFEHGERFYNFKGLRAFKSKFHPHWQPRYMAVSGGTGVVLALMDVTLLISGGVRGVVGK